MLAMAPGALYASSRSASISGRVQPIVLASTQAAEADNSFSAFGDAQTQTSSAATVVEKPRVKLKGLSPKDLTMLLAKNSSSGQAGSRFDGVKVVGDAKELIQVVGNCTTSSLSGGHVPGQPGICADSLTTACTTDADCSVSMSISDVTASEGNSGTTTFTHTVSLNISSGVNTTVNYATSNGTGTAGSDYTAASGSVIIPGGQKTATINISVLGDGLVEP